MTMNRNLLSRLRLQLSTIGNENLARRGAIRAPQLLQFTHQIHSALHLAEDHVPPVQVRCGAEGDKKLGPVGIRPGVRHGEQPALGMGHKSIVPLVLKSVPVDRLTPRPVAPGDVTPLGHEPRDDPVKNAALEMQLLPRLSLALLPGAQCAKILRGLGEMLIEELDLDTAGRLVGDLDIQEHSGVRLVSCSFSQRDLLLPLLCIPGFLGEEYKPHHHQERDEEKHRPIE
mmetsp:Transcript_29059/g.64004  ORF Transcript_29059/g.64004 Transcript_29059/m.64004 type:complete len:229 (-) Transcript_29059:482-1168(-)